MKIREKEPKQTKQVTKNSFDALLAAHLAGKSRLFVGIGVAVSECVVANAKKNPEENLQDSLVAAVQAAELQSSSEMINKKQNAFKFHSNLLNASCLSSIDILSLLKNFYKDGKFVESVADAKQIFAKCKKTPVYDYMKTAAISHEPTMGDRYFRYAFRYESVTKKKCGLCIYDGIKRVVYDENNIEHLDIVFRVLITSLATKGAFFNMLKRHSTAHYQYYANDGAKLVAYLFSILTPAQQAVLRAIFEYSRNANPKLFRTFYASLNSVVNANAKKVKSNRYLVDEALDTFRDYFWRANPRLRYVADKYAGKERIFKNPYYVPYIGRENDGHIIVIKKGTFDRFTKHLARCVQYLCLTRGEQGTFLSQQTIINSFQALHEFEFYRDGGDSNHKPEAKRRNLCEDLKDLGILESYRAYTRPFLNEEGVRVKRGEANRAHINKELNSLMLNSYIKVWVNIKGNGLWVEAELAKRHRIASLGGKMQFSKETSEEALIEGLKFGVSENKALCDFSDVGCLVDSLGGTREYWCTASPKVLAIIEKVMNDEPLTPEEEDWEQKLFEGMVNGYLRFDPNGLIEYDVSSIYNFAVNGRAINYIASMPTGLKALFFDNEDHVNMDMVACYPSIFLGILDTIDTKTTYTTDSVANKQALEVSKAAINKYKSCSKAERKQLAESFGLEVDEFKTLTLSTFMGSRYNSINDTFEHLSRGLDVLTDERKENVSILRRTAAKAIKRGSMDKDKFNALVEYLQPFYVAYGIIVDNKDFLVKHIDYLSRHNFGFNPRKEAKGIDKPSKYPQSKFLQMWNFTYSKKAFNKLETGAVISYIFGFYECAIQYSVNRKLTKYLHNGTRIFRLASYEYDGCVMNIRNLKEAKITREEAVAKAIQLANETAQEILDLAESTAQIKYENKPFVKV